MEAGTNETVVLGKSSSFRETCASAVPVFYMLCLLGTEGPEKSVWSSSSLFDSREAPRWRRAYTLRRHVCCQARPGKAGQLCSLAGGLVFVHKWFLRSAGNGKPIVISSRANRLCPIKKLFFFGLRPLSRVWCKMALGTNTSPDWNDAVWEY